MKQMENNTIKITVPKGFEVDFDKSAGEIKFKEKKKAKDVVERIKTYLDALDELGEKDEEVIIYRKLLTVLDSSSHQVAHQLAIVITKALNEDWTPDWDDNNQYKYAIWFYMGGSSGFRFLGDDSWRTYSRVGSRLCFKDSRLATYAGKQFAEVYKQFML